jgi:hypothetical protein
MFEGEQHVRQLVALPCGADALLKREGLRVLDLADVTDPELRAISQQILPRCCA